MKRKSLTWLSVLMALSLSACAAEENPISALPDMAETSAAETTAAETTAAETTAEETTTAETTEETTAETTKEETTVETTADEVPDGEIKTIPLSENALLIDYQYIEPALSSADADMEKRVLDAVRESEKFKETAAAIPDFGGEYRYFENEPFDSFFDENGDLMPKLSAVYTDDYDGDGDKESFCIVNVPMSDGDSIKLTNLLIFDGDETYEVWYGVNADVWDTIDYGICRQFVISSDGLGYESVTSIIGVIDGEAKSLYAIRGGFTKEGFLMGSYGHQASGSTMYYDTEVQEYRMLAGEPVDIKTIFEMDSSGIVKRDFADSEIEPGAVCFGNKYYCVYYPMDAGQAYTYENGEFVPYGERMNSAIRKGSDEYRLTVTEDFDLNEAFGRMISVEEAKALKK